MRGKTTVPSVAQQRQAMIQQNLAARNLALQYWPRQRILLGTQSIAAASFIANTNRFRLRNTGLTVALHLLVEVDVTIATASQTLSDYAPWNLIDRITLTDIDGTNRINISGTQLWQVLSERESEVYGTNNGASAAALAPASLNTPTAVASSTIRFGVELPIAYNKNKDLRGAMLTQMVNGEFNLAIDWTRNGTGAVLANTNDVGNYSTNATGTVTITAASVTAWQEVLYIQDIQGQNILPAMALDINTVYELAGYNRLTDFIAGTEYRLNVPNERTVVGIHLAQRNAGALSYTNVRNMRLLVGGNNPWEEWGNGSHLHDWILWHRSAKGYDLKPGMYSIDRTAQPLDTLMLGQMQVGITPNLWTAGSTSFTEVCFESFYERQAALPGIITQAG